MSFENKNGWCCDRETRSWDAVDVERDIGNVYRVAKAYANEDERDYVECVLFDRKQPGSERSRVLTAAVKEMAALISGVDNPTGFALKANFGGGIKYSVFDNNIVAYAPLCSYETETDALEAMNGLKGARIERNGKLFSLKVIDTEMTNMLRSHKCHGIHIGDYTTYEEAENVLSRLPFGYIEETPACSWWEISGRSSDSHLANLEFKSAESAIAYLYEKTMPPAWTAYVQFRKNF
jgi:hypothetical protein